MLRNKHEQQPQKLIALEEIRKLKIICPGGK